jgi:hypothetical protein
MVLAAEPPRGNAEDEARQGEAPPRARLGTQLASFKLPRGFVRIDALARTALGEIQKRLLPPWKPT